MWKDFFYFSKGQRIAITMLMLIISAVIAFSVYISHFKSSPPPPFDDSIANIVQEFKRNLISADSLRKAERQAEYENKYKQNSSYPSNDLSYELFNFDPNTADSISLTKLGLRTYIVSNIMKYRAKGGEYKMRENFAKTYGITDEKYEELKPYIQIAQKSSQETAQETDTSTLKFKSDIKVENVIVELNAADTATLMQVKGIGAFYAQGIVRLRNELGGYVSVDQVREVYGMTEENFEKIRASFTVNPQSITKIKLNTASVDKLKRHPYLNFYQSRAIYELRRKKGKLTSIEELKKLEQLDELTIEKVLPYLDFE